ncbi:hypothetical protein [Thalassoglobus sp.]|uniref:hypothetical protein n=1 Tax=Thalassoglobus sp. TaxID=2795869 RepID=UPI003AA9254E
MKRHVWTLFSIAAVCTSASAQEQVVPAGAKHYSGGQQYVDSGQYVNEGQFVDQGQYVPDGQFVEGGDFVGGASVGSQEPLFTYDDQEPWKHGYIKVMPYYHGYHSFRPYNYHQVFGQSTTAQGFGMSPVMPYSQQFWHRYEKMADLSQGNHEPVYPGTPPPRLHDHYPKPINQPAPVDEPSARLMLPYQGTLQPGQSDALQQSQPQNYSQIFQSRPQPGLIAPAQYQNNRPATQRPSLPAPRY